MNMNRDILDIITSRQSCRAYSGKHIEAEKLERIVEAGRLSPSARNSQPWTLYLATSEQSVNAVGECTRVNGRNKFTENCGAFIIVVEDENEAAFGSSPHRYFAEMDIGMCVMNMCLEAESIGVASCILGAFDAEGIKRVANIDEDRDIKLVVALGYAEEGYAVREKTRKSSDDCVKII